MAVSKLSRGVYRVAIPRIGRDSVVYSIIPSALGPNANLTRVVSGWQEADKHRGLGTAAFDVTNQWPPADLVDARVDVFVVHDE